MFDRFTPEVSDESVASIIDSLTKASAIIAVAVADFYARIAAGDNLKEAYVLLEDELKTGHFRRGSEDPRLEGIHPAWAIQKALYCVESRRRDDALMNPFIPRAEEWSLAEFLLDRLAPVALADLQATQTRVWGKLSGPAAADIVVAVANKNPGRLAPVRAKIGGKVAYGLIDSDERPRTRDGEERDRWHEPKEVR